MGPGLPNSYAGRSTLEPREGVIHCHAACASAGQAVPASVLSGTRGTCDFGGRLGASQRFCSFAFLVTKEKRKLGVYRQRGLSQGGAFRDGRLGTS